MNDGDMRVPPQALQPLRDRLTQMRDQLAKLDSAELNSDPAGLKLSIAETEALIKRLENPNGSRHP